MSKCENVKCHVIKAIDYTVLALVALANNQPKEKIAGNLGLALAELYRALDKLLAGAGEK